MSSVLVLNDWYDVIIKLSNLKFLQSFYQVGIVYVTNKIRMSFLCGP